MSSWQFEGRARAFSELPNGAQVSEPPYRFFLSEERAARRALLFHIAKAIPNPNFQTG